MTENLKMLVSLVSPDRITARLPLIPGFNSKSDVDASEKFLLSLGITDIDRVHLYGETIKNPSCGRTDIYLQRRRRVFCPGHTRQN